VDAAGQLAQLLERFVQLGHRAVQHLLRRRGILARLVTREAQL
jgi:hypothetical protein